MRTPTARSARAGPRRPPAGALVAVVFGGLFALPLGIAVALAAVGVADAASGAAFFLPPTRAVRQSANGLLPVFFLEFVGKGWLLLRAACRGGEREAVASRRLRAA